MVEEVAVSSTSEELPGGLGENMTMDEACANRSNGVPRICIVFQSMRRTMHLRDAIHGPQSGFVEDRRMADINGDGRDDMIIGGPLHDGPADSGMLRFTMGVSYRPMARACDV